MATTRRPWTREELLVALGLYLRVPFGQISQRHPEIIRHAELLNRSPAALSMKMGNLASLDDSLDRSGLSNASRADRAVWAELQADWTATTDAIAEATALIGAESVGTEKLPQSSATGEDVVVESKARRGQELFRATVLSAYKNRCCITGLSDSRLLTASHIVPWRTNSDNRLNPRNGLCLNALHDRAFDRGLITFDDELRLVLSAQIESSGNPFVLASFADYEGNRMMQPEKFAPNLDFVRFHREQVFVG